MNPSAWCSAVRRPFSAVAADASPTAPSGLMSCAIQPEAVLVRRAQMLVTLLHLGGLRREQLRLGHVDEVGPEMEHQRGLDVAGVNAVAHVEGGIES